MKRQEQQIVALAFSRYESKHYILWLQDSLDFYTLLRDRESAIIQENIMEDKNGRLILIFN